MSFDPIRVLCLLTDNEVRFVVIGQLAALMHGHPEATFDLDIVPEQDPDNAERLVEVLRGLDARLVVNGTAAGAAPDERDLLGWSTVREYDTSAGAVDVVPFAIGVGDYRTLMESASVMRVAGVDVAVASMDDVIASKAAAGRPKDLRQLPALRAFRDRPRGA